MPIRPFTPLFAICALTLSACAPTLSGTPNSKLNVDYVAEVSADSVTVRAELSVTARDGYPLEIELADGDWIAFDEVHLTAGHTAFGSLRYNAHVPAMLGDDHFTLHRADGTEVVTTIPTLIFPTFPATPPVAHGAPITLTYSPTDDGYQLTDGAIYGTCVSGGISPLQWRNADGVVPSPDDLTETDGGCDAIFDLTIERLDLDPSSPFKDLGIRAALYASTTVTIAP
jgi:hypothetical protein